MWKGGTGGENVIFLRIALYDITSDSQELYLFKQGALFLGIIPKYRHVKSMSGAASAEAKF